MKLRPFTALLIPFFLVFSCSSVKQIAIERDVADILKKSPVFSKHFTGFSLFDLDKNQFISEHNSTLLFTPASNTKLLTMYAALKTFPDSIPGLIYTEVEKSTVVQPIGDPTFLYSKFQSQIVAAFLSNRTNVKISWPEKSPAVYGRGWAWDDYQYDFQPQISWWPIYGNSVSIDKRGNTTVIDPPFFEDFVEIKVISESKPTYSRDLRYNNFTITLESDTSSFRANIPFEYSRELLHQLLNDTLGINASAYDGLFISTDTLYSQSLDAVLIEMMKPSDNFLAEHLLLLAGWKNGYESIEDFIGYVKSVWLADFRDFVWVDGSGLSRYNLIAPVDQVRILKKCIDEFGWDRITKILPTGGEGTLKGLYPAEYPYIYAKSGTLSNNYSLSGYLITNSGKRLIFSFMNNHYTDYTLTIKKEVERFLTQIKEAY